MTLKAYAQSQGQKPKRKGSAKDFIERFAPGMVVPGVTEKADGN